MHTNQKIKEVRLRAFLVDKGLELWDMTYSKNGQLRRRYTQEEMGELKKFLNEIAEALGISIRIEKTGVFLSDTQ